jgi:hypothetical protein
MITRSFWGFNLIDIINQIILSNNCKLRNNQMQLQDRQLDFLIPSIFQFTIQNLNKALKKKKKMVILQK